MIISIPKSDFGDGQINKAVLLRRIAWQFPGVVPTFDASADPVEFTFIPAPVPEFTDQFKTFIVPAHTGNQATPYTFSISTFDAEKIHDLAKGLTGYSHTTTDVGSVTFWFDPSQAEQDAAGVAVLQALVDNYDPMVDARRVKMAQIDHKTIELISKGFVYSGKTFSLSDNAEKKLITWRIKADGGDATTRTAPTIDNGDTHTLIDAAAVIAFTDAAFDVIQGHIDTGEALRASVRAAADQDAIDAVADTR